MLFLIFALALLLISTATAAPVVLSMSEPTKVTVMMTSFITSTLTTLLLATAWPVQARQWSKPAAPVWTEPAAPVWSEPAVWPELATWAPVPTVTSYSWTDAVSYSYTDVPSSATATSSPSYSYETHRPAVSGPSMPRVSSLGSSSPLVFSLPSSPTLWSVETSTVVNARTTATQTSRWPPVCLVTRLLRLVQRKLRRLRPRVSLWCTLLLKMVSMLLLFTAITSYRLCPRESPFLRTVPACLFTCNLRTGPLVKFTM
jgi:hypothetical protein